MLSIIRRALIVVRMYKLCWTKVTNTHRRSFFFLSEGLAWARNVFENYVCQAMLNWTEESFLFIIFSIFIHFLFLRKKKLKSIALTTAIRQHPQGKNLNWTFKFSCVQQQLIKITRLYLLFPKALCCILGFFLSGWRYWQHGFHCFILLTTSRTAFECCPKGLSWLSSERQLIHCMLVFKR